MLFWIIVWLASVFAVWRGARYIVTSLSFPPDYRSRVLASLASGAAISYAFAPSAISGGMVVIPAPASMALWFAVFSGDLFRRSSILHLGSLLLVFLVAAGISYIRSQSPRDTEKPPDANSN